MVDIIHSSNINCSTISMILKEKIMEHVKSAVPLISTQLQRSMEK